MKIVAHREALDSAFQLAAMVAPARSPKPLFNNVKVEATKEGVVLSATDGDLRIRVDVPGTEVESPGSILVPASRFANILRESSDDKLLIESTSRGTDIRGEHSKISLSSEDPGEFPVVPAFRDEKYHTLSERLLRELVRRTEFATDNESSRYALGGVLLEMGPEKITAVATDGRRLAKMEGPAQSIGGHQTGDTTTIVRTRAVNLIGRIVGDSDAEVRLAARGNDVVLVSNRATLYSQLVEGRFPKWRDVFPSRREARRIELTVAPTYAALRQASIVASDESRGIDCAFEDGLLVLTASTPEVGQSRVELPVAYEGSSVAIKLDHRFLADFLRVLDPEKSFTMEVADAEAAALFTTDDGYGYVIMPLARE
jgi:DNA polymerase-3 subunit beta